MRLHTIAIAFALTAAGTAPLAAQLRASSDTALASMVASERAFSQRSRSSTTQAAFLAWMAPNSVIYRPRVVRAHTYLRERPMPADLLLLWEPVFADMSAAGDLGYTTGPWIASSRSKRDAMPTFGQYVTIWRRQPDGAWKAELDAGIAHAPDPVGPVPLRTPPAPEWRSRGAAPKGAEAALMAADSALAAAAKDGTGTAIQRRAAAHLRVLRNGRFPLQGDSASAYLRATAGYTWQPVAAGVSGTGDLGYTYGVYAVVPTRGGRASETGDYLRIWRRDASGAWRVALDLTSPAQ